MATEQIVIDFIDADFSKLSFGKKKKTQYNSDFISIFYDGKIPCFKFPKMSTSFGVSNYEGSYSLSTSYDEKNTDETSEAWKVLQKSKEFDECIKKVSIKNFKDWFAKPKKGLTSEQHVESEYKPMVVYPTDKAGNPLDYPPRSKTTFYVKDGKLGFDCYNSKNTKLALTEDNHAEHITPGSLVASARFPNRIWFSNMGFGVSWKLLQAKVYPKPNALSSCILGGSDAEEEDDEETGVSVDGRSQHSIEKDGEESDVSTDDGIEYASK